MKRPPATPPNPPPPPKQEGPPDTAADAVAAWSVPVMLAAIVIGTIVISWHASRDKSIEEHYKPKPGSHTRIHTRHVFGEDEEAFCPWRADGRRLEAFRIHEDSRGFAIICTWGPQQ